MLNKLIAPLMIVVLVFVFWGCSENSTQPNETDQFGDLTTVSEAPAFGDPVLLAETEAEVSYNDPILVSPGFDSLTDDTMYGKYHLRILWGQLRYDSTFTNPTDWTGSLTISYGGIAVRRLIHWELNQDFLLPRTDRKLVEWQSTTTVHNDGLAFDLYIPEMLPTFDSSYSYIIDDTGLVVDSTLLIDTVYNEPEPVTVAFETGPYSHTFDLAELTDLDTIVYLEDSNAVAFNAIKVDPRFCAGGMVRGMWGYDENGQGNFRGMWHNRNGELTGYLKGEYKIDDNGRNLFLGKWIDEDGNCQGFVRGYYQEGPSVAFENALRNHGVIVGKVYNAEKAEIGVFVGRFKAGFGSELGYFQARWRLYCPNAEEEQFGGEELNLAG